MPDEGPKIFVDEDWKARVQREKEEAARKQAVASEAPAQAAEAQPDAAATPSEEKPAAEGAGMPEANFDALVASLATQAMFALGVIAPRDSKQVYIDLDQAQYMIDTLAMLREKTKGNLSPEESGRLNEALAELQQVYVARVHQFQEAQLRQAGVNLDELRKPH